MRSEVEPWLGEDVREELGGWAGGPLGIEIFGTQCNSLDALCLIAAYEKQLPFVLWAQIQNALEDGFSWNEIAAALGVSRQAATKRFDRA